MNAAYIKEAVARYYMKKHMCCHFEVGLNKGGRLRADVITLSMRGELYVIEVKSSRQDFISDHKWTGYMNYCHRFLFAMSDKTYDAVKSHIPKGVGVLLVRGVRDRYGKVSIGSVRSAQSSRRKDLPPDIASNLIIRMAFRSSDRNRFKSLNKG